MRWVGHKHVLEEKCIQNFGGNLKERHHLEDLGIVMSIILKWILKKWDWRVWTECGSGQKPVAAFVNIA
jgi:hypothetical protein